MEFLQLIVVALALGLFFLFIVQPFLIAFRLTGSRLSNPRPRSDFELGPDDVEPLPILDTKELPSFYTLIGRDRFGRMIFRSPYDDGRVGFFYLDREASEARRLKEKRRPAASSEPRAEGSPGLALGWKGFTADSSPWEVLGVARDASIAQVKAAHQKLVRNFHPDRSQNLSAAEVAELERDAKLINAAYAELVKS